MVTRVGYARGCREMAGKSVGGCLSCALVCSFGGRVVRISRPTRSSGRARCRAPQTPAAGLCGSARYGACMHCLIALRTFFRWEKSLDRDSTPPILQTATVVETWSSVRHSRSLAVVVSEDWARPLHDKTDRPWRCSN